VFRPGQVVTVFRSRLRPEHRAAYEAYSEEIFAVARTMPGLVDIKDFTAEDGERVAIVTFADHATQEAWRRHVDHAAAQQRGRDDFYSEYSVQVCDALRVSVFPPPAEP